jgi:DNA-binding CsgD family transcriptional regulator
MSKTARRLLLTHFDRRDDDVLAEPLRAAALRATYEANDRGRNGSISIVGTRSGTRCFISASIDDSEDIIVSLRESARRVDGAADALRARFGLSARQLDIVEELMAGRTNRQISETVGLQVSTVKGYLTEIFERLDVSSRSEAIARVESLRRGES